MDKMDKIDSWRGGRGLRIQGESRNCPPPVRLKVLNKGPYLGVKISRFKIKISRFREKISGFKVKISRF